MRNEDLIALANSHGAKWPDNSECELTRGELLSLLRAVQAAERERWRTLLADVSKQARHTDYDWPACLQREVDEALRPNVGAKPQTPAAPT